MKALLSVYDKTNITDFARALHDSGHSLISTGGTHAAISSAGIPAQHVEDITGFPEILDGRVKSLHPYIYGGILARRDIAEHNAQLEKHGIGTIDVVASNLYPFVDTVSRPDATLIDALENIDIGGPTMIRGAAKNFPHVIVVVDPADYEWISESLVAGKPLTLEQRKKLARKAFQHVALYDTTISQYLGADALELDESTFGFSKAIDPALRRKPTPAGRPLRRAPIDRRHSPRKAACTASTCHTQTTSTPTPHGVWSQTSISRQPRSSSTPTPADSPSTTTSRRRISELSRGTPFPLTVELSRSTAL